MLTLPAAVLTAGQGLALIPAGAALLGLRTFHERRTAIAPGHGSPLAPRCSGCS